MRVFLKYKYGTAILKISVFIFESITDVLSPPQSPFTRPPSLSSLGPGPHSLCSHTPGPQNLPALAPGPHPPSPSSGSRARPGLRGLQKAAALARAPQECATYPHYSPARGSGGGGGAPGPAPEAARHGAAWRGPCAQWRRSGRDGAGARPGAAPIAAAARRCGGAAAPRRAQAGRGGAADAGRPLSTACSARTRVRPDSDRSCGGSSRERFPERGALAQSAEAQARAPPPAPPGSAGAGPGLEAGLRA